MKRKALIVISIFLVCILLSFIVTLMINEEPIIPSFRIADSNSISSAIIASPCASFEKLGDNSGCIEILGNQLPLTSTLQVSGEPLSNGAVDEANWKYKIILNNSDLLKNGEEITIFVSPEGFLINNRLYPEIDVIGKKISTLDKLFEYYSVFLEVK